jgi:hypothetical protein
MRGRIVVRRTVDLSALAGTYRDAGGTVRPASATVTDTSPAGEYDPDLLPRVVDAQLARMTRWRRTAALEWSAADANGNPACVRLVPEGEEGAP